MSNSENDIVQASISKESENSVVIDERPTLPLSDDSSSETSTTTDNSLDVINEPDYVVRDMEAVD